MLQLLLQLVNMLFVAESALTLRCPSRLCRCSHGLLCCTELYITLLQLCLEGSHVSIALRVWPLQSYTPV